MLFRDHCRSSGVSPRVAVQGEESVDHLRLHQRRLSKGLDVARCRRGGKAIVIDRRHAAWPGPLAKWPVQSHASVLAQRSRTPRWRLIRFSLTVHVGGVPSVGHGAARWREGAGLSHTRLALLAASPTRSLTPRHLPSHLDRRIAVSTARLGLSLKKKECAQASTFFFDLDWDWDFLPFSVGRAVGRGMSPRRGMTRCRAGVGPTGVDDACVHPHSCHIPTHPRTAPHHGTTHGASSRDATCPSPFHTRLSPSTPLDAISGYFRQIRCSLALVIARHSTSFHLRPPPAQQRRITHAPTHPPGLD